MDISIFLAKVMGLYFIIVSLFTFIRYKDFPPLIKSMSTERGTLLLLAIITLIIGLLLVISHNVWVNNWRVLITILSWLILIGGLFRLFFQEPLLHIGQWWSTHKPLALIISAIFFLIGLFLTYKGFW